MRRAYVRGRPNGGQICRLPRRNPWSYRSAGAVQFDWISSIATERVGMHVRLTLTSMGSTIDMEVSRAKATTVLEVLRSMLSSAPSDGV